MQPWLVVRVVDAEGTPLDASVTAQIGQEKLPRAGAPVKPPGVGLREFELPRYGVRVLLQATKAGFFDLEQVFKFAPHAETPTLTPDGRTHPGVRALALASRGDDLSLEVHLVLSQVRDARSKSIEVALNPPPTKPPIPSLLFPPKKPREIPLVEDNGIVTHRREVTSGPHLVRFRHATCVGAGRILFAERETVPKLVILWVPDGVDFASSDRPTIDFHVFFHECDTRASASGYPFRWRYIDQAYRHLFPEKRLAYQHEAAKKNVVLVFPVGLEEGHFGELSTPKGLERVLVELCYWLPRMGGDPWPRKRIGRVAVSAMASAINEVHRLLAGLRRPGEDSCLKDCIREVYDFDGASDIPTRLISDLRDWLTGAPGRVLRVYQRDTRYAALRDAIGGSESKRAFPDHSTLEVESERGSLVILPSAFWARIDPRWYDARVVDLIPSLFLYHSLMRSGFASL